MFAKKLKFFSIKNTNLFNQKFRSFFNQKLRIFSNKKLRTFYLKHRFVFSAEVVFFRLSLLANAELAILRGNDGVRILQFILVNFFKRIHVVNFTQGLLILFIF